MKILTDCFTERDGTSWCFIRIASVPVLVAAVYVLLVTHQDFMGFAAVVTGVFGAIGYKNWGERQ